MATEVGVRVKQSGDPVVAEGGVIASVPPGKLPTQTGGGGGGGDIQIVWPLDYSKAF